MWPMNSAERETKVIEGLTSEHSSVVKLMNDLLKSQDTMVAFGAVIFGTWIAAIGWSGEGKTLSQDSKTYASILLPVGLLLNLVYYANVVKRFALLSGYRRLLEEQLNSHLRKGVYLWEGSIDALLGATSITKV